jgi:hypothetical protein
MTTTRVNEQEIDAYIRRLLWALQTLPHDDRLGIASEIHSHLSECAVRGDAELDRALGKLGPADALARSYVEDYELAGAVNRSAPTTLLLNILNRGTRSLLAFFGGLAALSLYLIAGSLALIAVAKPIVPGQVGAWKGAHIFSMGITDAPPGDVKEVLGYWIIPIAIILGAISFVGAGKLLRLVGRRLLARAKNRIAI